ncbi:MAG: hypothetical protein QOG57_6501, partial [Pseudonocardiales bacterium]|nr:hypothetical protein [Pseudonocardiales bacterium]
MRARLVISTARVSGQSAVAPIPVREPRGEVSGMPEGPKQVFVE